MFRGRLEKSLRGVTEERLPALEGRVHVVEQHIAGYLRQLNTVLQGLTDVNKRLVREKTDPKVVAKELRQSPPYQTLAKKVQGLESELARMSATVTQLNLRIFDVESQLKRLGERYGKGD